MTVSVKIALNSATQQTMQAGSLHKQGRVHLDVAKSTNATSQFYGIEETRVDYSYNNGNSSVQTTRTARSTNSLVDIQILSIRGDEFSAKLVNQRNGNVDPGHYEFPFELQIPENLPASMKIGRCKGKTATCEIRYGLTARVGGSGRLWKRSKAAAELSVCLQCKPMEELPPSQCDAPPKIQRVNACYIINRGHIALGAKVHNTRLAAGSQCCADIAVRNYSKARVERVEAKLVQQAKWTAGGAGRLSKGHSARTTNTVTSAEFINILPDTLPQGKQRRADMEANLEQLFKEIKDGTHKSKLVVPSGLLETYPGGLIQVAYQLELRVVTPTCVDNPTIQIPVFVGRREQEPGQQEPTR